MFNANYGIVNSKIIFKLGVIVEKKYMDIVDIRDTLMLGIEIIILKEEWMLYHTYLRGFPTGSRRQSI